MNSQVGKYRVNINFPKFELLTERMCKFIKKDSNIIRADGEVASCYRLLHSYTEYAFGRKKEVNAYSFGNALEKSIYEIWNRKEYKVFRYNVKKFTLPFLRRLSLQKSVRFCQNYRLGLFWQCTLLWRLSLDKRNYSVPVNLTTCNRWKN
jgi:hypothetical protein